MDLPESKVNKRGKEREKNIIRAKVLAEEQKQRIILYGDVTDIQSLPPHVEAIQEIRKHLPAKKKHLTACRPR